MARVEQKHRETELLRAHFLSWTAQVSQQGEPAVFILLLVLSSKILL